MNKPLLHREIEEILKILGFTCDEHGNWSFPLGVRDSLGRGTMSKEKAELAALIEAYTEDRDRELRFYRELTVIRAGLQPREVKAKHLYAELQNNIHLYQLKSKKDKHE